MTVIANFFKWIFIHSEAKYNNKYDSKIISAVILLLVIGITMVYSASIAYADADLHNNKYYFLIRHIISITIGAVVGLYVFKKKTDFWKNNAIFITIAIMLLLLLVLVPHVGHVVNGARRWIGVATIGLQPSELAKLGIVIYLSYYLSKYRAQKSQKINVIPPVLVLLSFSLLLLLEPDMGTTTVVFILALAMFYLSEINKKFIITLGCAGVVGFIVLVIIEPYRIKRFLGFLNPWQDALGKGYQLTHSLLAIGHGGWFGVGLGNSIEKLFYLPEAHTDFILAILIEELGMVGVLVVVLLFWIIFYRGFVVIATQTKTFLNRQFQVMLAQGISLWFLIQAMINIGVTLGLLPTKGLTLPFISYGGSSIVINFIALAILLKIDYENKQF